MKHIDKIEKMEHTCITFGSFDGIHLGHRAVVGKLVEESRRTGRQSVVVSCFQAEGVLTTELEKAWLLEKMGVDVLVSLPAELSRREGFIQKVLIEELGAEQFIIGEECSDRKRLETCGVKLTAADTVCAEGKSVTAADVEKCLDRGDMEGVAALCGHPYIMLGKVVHGKALGRTVGMPTANLKIYGSKRRPPNGVYATCTEVENGRYPGVTNVGTRPSVDNSSDITIETMLADFDQDIYGEKVMTEFHSFIRGIRKFDGIEAVWQQVQKDLEQAKVLLFKQ
ncbi:riboflavin kinase [Lachnospiraceae bacterium 46-15]